MRCRDGPADCSRYLTGTMVVCSTSGECGLVSECFEAEQFVARLVDDGT